MHPLFHPRLINEPFGDPGLFIAALYDRQALLFDLGDLAPLSARDILRVNHIFVSHAHMDHFGGFDRWLRLSVGRDKQVTLFGPAGFIACVGHKLLGYTWNLAPSFRYDLVLRVTEVLGDGQGLMTSFRLRDGFRATETTPVALAGDILVDEEAFQVRAAVLDHGTPCLAFALEEKCHVNVWKAAVEAAGFQVGPWLRELRLAVLRDDPDDRPLRVWWRENGVEVELWRPLGELRDRLLSVVPGQKIGYVVDAMGHAANIARIVQLVQGADVLFIEAPFAGEDQAIADAKRHLSAPVAGRIARAAAVKRLEPFHFSTRYAGRGERLRDEALAAFAGTG
jgi:ribonuclease Z